MKKSASKKTKASAGRAKAKPAKKAAKKPAAKATGRPTAPDPRPAPYTPQPIEGIGWAPFRYTR